MNSKVDSVKIEVQSSLIYSATSMNERREDNQEGELL